MLTTKADILPLDTVEPAEALMAQSKFTARLLVIAGMLFLLAAVVPVFRGQRSNTVFTAVGVALFVIGLATAKKPQSTPDA